MCICFQYFKRYIKEKGKTLRLTLLYLEYLKGIHMSNRLTNFVPVYGTHFFPLFSNSKTFALKKEKIYLPYKEIQQILSGLQHMSKIDFNYMWVNEIGNFQFSMPIQYFDTNINFE